MGHPFALLYTYAFGSGIYMLVIAFLTVPANSALLLAICVDRFKAFRSSPSTYLLVGVSLADMLMGLLQEPLYYTVFIMVYTKHPKRKELSAPIIKAVRFISGIAITSSLLIILAFTVTQYIVIASPLKHARRIAKKKVFFTVSLIYVYSTLFWTLYYWVQLQTIKTLDIHSTKLMHFLHMILVPVLNIIFFILLHGAFKNKMKQTASLQSESRRQQQDERDKRLRVERMFVTVNFMLLAILIFCSQPAAIFWWLRTFWLTDEGPSVQIGIANLMVDNIVYAWRLPKYRKALKKILHCPNLVLKRQSKYQGSVEATITKSTETVVTLSMKDISVLRHRAKYISHPDTVK